MRSLSKFRAQRTLEPVQLQLKLYTPKELQKVTNISFAGLCVKLWRRRQTSNITSNTKWR